MIISIDHHLRLRGTDHCWQLEKLKVVNCQNEWRAFKYFTTVDSALHEAAQRELRLFPSNTLPEAFAACRTVTDKYARIFDDVGRLAEDAA
jgi:hypothetical protein